MAASFFKLKCSTKGLASQGNAVYIKMLYAFLRVINIMYSLSVKLYWASYLASIKDITTPGATKAEHAGKKSNFIQLYLYRNHLNEN